MEQKQRLFLIDGSALAYRTFFAFIRNPLINSKGENVSAVFGFTKTLLNIIDTQNPDYLAVIFDTPEPTFRHKLYKEYKAQRVEMPKDMEQQIPRINQMLEVLNIPNISKPGFEADDIMGTLAKQAEKKELMTVIVTGDKDMLQLVNTNTLVLNPKRSGEEPEWLDAKAVNEKIGIPPERIVDYLALVGDSSDNIPGVKGIGPQNALKLLNEYKTIEDVLENIDNISSKRARSSIKEYGEDAKLSKKLVTLDCCVKLDFAPDQLELGVPDKQKAVDFFQELEISSLVDRFSEHKKQKNLDYQVVQDLDAFVDELKRCKSFSFDTETTDVNPLNARLVGLSFSWNEAEAYYIPVMGPVDMTAEYQPLPLDKVIQSLKPILQDAGIKKTAHNAKYDILVLKRYNIVVQGLDFDTMLANYLINPSLRQHNIDNLSLSFLNLKKIPTTSLLGRGKKQITMDKVPIEKVKDYACEDADVAWRLREILDVKLNEMQLANLFRKIEIPLLHVLTEMENTGVALDEKFLKEMSINLDKELEQLEMHIYDLAGEKFNINSPKQLSVILFENLELPVIRRTKTGYSTDMSVLEELSKQHDLPKKLLDYRQLIKLKSTYVDALPRLISKDTGRLHTSFNQTVTATGRLSSSDPNLQNIPIRTDVGRRIRKAFIARDDQHVLLDADYSQIELRIMAHLSKDQNLIDAFVKDQDIHTRTAALVFDVDADNVTKDQRRKAKEVNFGIIYGMGAYGLSRRLDITPEEANEFIQAYFANYPGVHQYMTDIVARVRETGYVTTLMDRRRYIPEITSENKRIRDFAERTAINTPIQGSAADLIKIAMIRLQEKIEQKELESKMILQVHDELIFDVAKKELDMMRQLVKTEMENAIELVVPVKVELGVGNNWLDAH